MDEDIRTTLTTKEAEFLRVVEPPHYAGVLCHLLISFRALVEVFGRNASLKCLHVVLAATFQSAYAAAAERSVIRSSLSVDSNAGR